MGNNDVYKTVVIDNIRMRIFDRFVRTLMNVHHVLHLRKNLLLLGALEAQGCKFSGADGGIKVSKDSMTILKGNELSREVSGPLRVPHLSISELVEGMTGRS